MSESGAVSVDPSQSGVVYRAQGGCARQRHRAVAASGADSGRWRDLERAECGGAQPAWPLPPGGLATGNTTVQLVDNGDKRLYADNRRTQVDMRFAKILRFGRTRTDVGVDLYNLLNSNYALGYDSNYSLTQPNGGTWLNPTSILSPRFARFNITVNY